jgi:glutamyl-tRNA synthetase
MSVRVRYAPSPTGYQHIGGARTALFNYFFARANGGQFILRVEDTDQERFFDEALSDLYETMAWLGIQTDEDPQKGGSVAPYVQSERTYLYRQYAQQLLDSGHAYYCYCSTARLERIRKIHEANSMPPGYDRHCRHLTAEEIAEYKHQGIKPVIRLKIPLEGSVTVHDELLGDITSECSAVNPDPVLMKSDGYPTYHLANIIDDHLMGITHVLRAQEWVPSAPLHALLYQAFGWQMPKLCHLPMVMGQDGQKLSKRHGATSVREFRSKGYLPEAVINYISLLGWSYDDSREFFSMDELCQLFKLERLNKSPAVFDYKKLDWFNGHYIRKLTADQLLKATLPFIQTQGWFDSNTSSHNDMLLQTMPLIQERMHVLTDAVGLLKFFFIAPETYLIEDAIPKKMDLASTIHTLISIRQLFADIDLAQYNDDMLECICRDKSDLLGIKIGQFLQPLRVALTGSTMSPPLFGSIRILGIQQVLLRVDNLLNFLQKHA